MAAGRPPGGPMLEYDDGDILRLDPSPLILVVEDELTPRSIVTRMVRSLGFRARGYHRGAAALGFLHEHPGVARLVLADLGMPRMDGGELAERVQDLEPRLRVALMAGRDDPHVDDLLAGYSDLPFLAKPVAFTALAELLAVLVGIPVTTTNAVGRPRERRRSVRYGMS